MSSVEGEPQVPNERRKVFFGLFVFPMLIAVKMAVLLTSIVLLTQEDETPESLITAIKTGAPSKRWQKAFELSNELNSPAGLLRSAGIMNEMIHILHGRDRYDAKTRAYMAMALSRFRNEEAQNALLEALRDEPDTEDPKVILFLMWALGDDGMKNGSNVAEPTVRYRYSKRPTAAQPSSAEPTAGLSEPSQTIARFLSHEEPDVRKGAAYVLGVLGDPNAREGLGRLLSDAVADVRWNAALSLARLGDNAGEDVLVTMLERQQLESTHALGESEIERIMTNAAKGLGLIQSERARAVLEEIAATDKNLKVRQAALAALEHR